MLVAREAEAVVEEEELVGAVAIAVENLIARVEGLAVLVNQVEVCVLIVVLRFKPVKFLIGLLAVQAIAYSRIIRVIQFSFIRWMVFSRLGNIKPFILL